MSSSLRPFLPLYPPEYAPEASLPGLPLYSQNAASSEVLVEASQPPPPYPNLNITPTTTTSTPTTSSPNASNASHTGNPVDYRCSSGSIEISLGPKVPGWDIPSYGKGGVVRGTVTLKRHTWVERVVVKLEGIAQTAITQHGMPVGRSFIAVLNLTQVLYAKAKREPRPTAPQSYPFEFVFPAGTQNSDEPLPPTFRAIQPLMESHVRYQILVQVVKSGLWPSENLSTIIHYLPKSHPSPCALLWPHISLMDAKRFGLECNGNWKTTEARPGPEVEAGMRVFVSIPRTAQTVAARCFPVNVTLRTPCKKMLQAFVDNTTIQVVRSVVLSAEGNKSAHTCGIGRGKVQQIESELVDENTRIIRAGTCAGVVHGESSWKIGGIVEVEYFIRVMVVNPETRKVLFQHDEAIEMFTHENTDTGFELWDEPASGLLLGTSLHAGTRAFR